MAGPQNLNATVEDYDSDNSDDHSYDDRNDPVLESFRRSPAANITAKRSHPSDLGNDKSPPVEKVVHIDLQSDSGYSSHYAGTMSSADSALSSPPSAPASAASLPPTSPAIKRRPTINDERKNTSQGSPRKAPQRSGSVATRNPRERRPTVEMPDCTDPDCTECGPNVKQSSRGRRNRNEFSPLDSGLDVSYPPFDQRSAPSYISTPQSPTYTRPAPYMQGSAVIQPAQSTRRRSSSTTRAPRPVSYHAGDAGNYWAAGMQPPYSNPQDIRGPPPSMSAHYSTMHHAPPQMPPFMPPPPPNYYPPMPGLPMQTSPPYDVQMQRPPMHSRTSSNYHTRARPPSGYGQAVITQDQPAENMPSARYAPVSQPQRRLLSSEFDSESSECESSDEEEEVQVRNARSDRLSRAIMPPPPLPANPSAKRRPSLRHAAPAQVYNSDRRMSQSQTAPERPRERDPRERDPRERDPRERDPRERDPRERDPRERDPRERDPRDSRSTRGSTAAPSRAASRSRPALIQHPKAQSAFESQRNARVVVENSRAQRTQSYQGYEKPYEAEEKRRANRNSRIYADEGKRSSKIYADEVRQTSRIYDEDAIVPTRRRQTDTDARRREEQIMETKNLQAAMDAEAYLRSTRGSNEPLTDKVHKAAKRASRVPSGPSEAESSRSKGSDKASRISMSNRTTVTNGGASGEIRLRVDASAPLSLQFNGDMEGRTLSINPTEDGMADIVIGNPGSRGENVYRSERGSVLGSTKTVKAIMASQARREAEDASVRSERSLPSRRNEERRVLQRRRRELEYN